MLLNKMIKFAYLAITLSTLIATARAQPSENALGQTIQIHTRFHSFVGKPQWLLIIRDIDHNRNIPYLYDIKKGTNFWVAYTYSRNYLISVSNLQFAPYRTNPYRSKAINNFCHLESNGAIIKGESLYITITGDLSPNTNTFNCDVLRYSDSNFTVAHPN